jgi:hypothetical protein
MVKNWKDETLLPILYVGYSITGRMPEEEYLERVFSKYGKVIFIKCIRADRNKGRRSYAFVEYDSLVQIPPFFGLNF